MPKPNADLADIEEQLRAKGRLVNTILGRADAAKRDLSADEQRRINALHAECEELLEEHRVARRNATMEPFDALADEVESLVAYNATSAGRVTTANPIANPGTMQRRVGAPAARIGAPVRSFAALTASHQAAPPVYEHQFQTLGEFCMAVAAGAQDHRLIRNATQMTTGTGADGGFAVPHQFLGPILDAALAREVVRPRANVVPLASKTASIPTFDYADGTSAKRGGLQLLWGAEATALTEQKGKLREVNLSPHKGSIFVRVSNELAEDAPAFDRQLSDAMVAAVASGLDYAFMNGTGAGQPLGILSAPNLITVAKESGQAANTVLLQNLAGMAGRLAPASFGAAVWLVHPTVVVKLYLMSYTVTNLAGTENVGGSHVQAITQDADGTLRIFGRPCIVTDSVSALSSAGDIVLADLSKYIVGLRADATIKRDESRYFDSDELAFRLTLRIDGQPADQSTTTLRDGSNTVGPFVALGAR